MDVAVHYDERSAAFMALGTAMATRAPVGVITTSGTAAAELLPGVVEAYQSQVPLILITADRPAHLRGTGSNQTIMQPGIYSSYVMAERDLPAGGPMAETSIRRAVSALWDGTQEPNPGPVHLNVQLVKPFEPVHAAGLGPVTAAETGPPHPVRENSETPRLDHLTPLLKAARQGVIVVGPGRYPSEFRDAVTRLAHAAGMPILADPLSGCRRPSSGPTDMVIGGTDALTQTALLDDMRLDAVIRFGGLPVSLRKIDFYERRLQAGAPHIYVNASGRRHDERGAVTHCMRCDPVRFCHTLARQLDAATEYSAWCQRWMRLDESVRGAARDALRGDPLWDGGYAMALVEAAPAESVLMVGNSLPVRLLDLMSVGSRARAVYGNRGASGIDGLLATAIGLARTTDHPVILMLGDLSLLHDIGSLAAVRQLALRNLVIVVLNNNGGGIFERLPVAAMDEVFESLFAVPHGLRFRELAQGFGLGYADIEGYDRFQTALRDALDAPASWLLEIQTNRREDKRRAAEFVQSIQERCEIESQT